MAANPKILPPYPISITNDTPNPAAIAIDKDGCIQFTSDANYTIEWKDEHGNKGTFWSPQPPTVSQGVNPVQDALPSADHHTLTYTLGPKFTAEAVKITAEETIAAQGGGTIKVGT